MYNYYLGGKDNYAVDREAAEKALSAVRCGRRSARANRYFLMRAVLLMADQGIRQFVDLGTGIPTSPNVHELARAIHPEAHVLYVDNDPVVTAHNRALLATDDGIRALQADIRDPEAILASAELRKFIDFTQPVGVLFVAVLHFVRDREDPQGIVRSFTDRMASGSYLALSHITKNGTDPSVMATIHEVYSAASAPAIFRAEAEISAFFDGFDLIRPGLVDVTQWFPYAGVFSARPPAVRFLSGVGRKI
jgi:S-adenosyl methyltransferase